ncbi:hypothetical protein DWG18_11920 [Lysobacter sp. TY2-98]|uniref:hypothetical protein n=1 Tax=Lysobacter sp. TY2-98 TaxID=2290922 RepID=UPI000E1FF496|nr:hypothetical protein [Lysobacter sp. TY2-98]AXK72912.1 hypothetical protein DWG18_11920 [Lysobacter sp. TY2-98]
MTTPKKPSSESPHMIRASNKGEVDTQGHRDTPLSKDSKADQSEGVKGGGQPTGMHGRGAGFGRPSR